MTTENDFSAEDICVIAVSTGIGRFQSVKSSVIQLSAVGLPTTLYLVGKGYDRPAGESGS